MIEKIEKEKTESLAFFALCSIKDPDDVISCVTLIWN